MLTNSPGVRLHISIKDKKVQDYPEVIRDLSKGYEEVEVDGLVFRRKRKVSARSPDSVKKSRSSVIADIDKPIDTPAGKAEDGMAKVSPPAVTSVKTTKSTDDDENVAICRPDPLGSAQSKDDASTKPRPDIARIAQSILQDLPHSATEAERLGSAQSNDDASTNPRPDIARIAQSILQDLPQSATEAERLLCICDKLPLMQAQLQWEGCKDLLAALRAQISCAFQEGTLICHVPKTSVDPQTEVAEGKQKRLSILQQQLEALEKERAEWLAVLQEGQNLSERFPVIGPDAEAEDHAPAKRDVILEEVQRQTHATLSFQVEGLAMMITNIEQLVDKAEAQCRLMQVEYHKEKFFKVPHIDSPARLIHDIVRPRKAAVLG